MTSTHTHSPNSYGKFAETTGTPGTLEHGSVNPTNSGACGVPVSSPPACSTGTPLEHAQPQQPNPAALFVSTTLNSWQTERPDAFHRDVQVNDTAYRRLDPQYYAWLRSKMNLAKLAAIAGRLAQDEFDCLRESFNRIHGWAITRFGEVALGDAVRTLDARDYQPPVTEQWDRRPASPETSKSAVHASAVAVVDAIRDQAISLGWKHERLYAAGKALSPNRGLAAYMSPGDRIGEVTRGAIEIILPNGVRQHFYNPDVEQPWVRRTVAVAL